MRIESDTLGSIAVPDDAADLVIADDFPLVRLFARARCRTGGLADPLVAFLHHHRTAVIDDLPFEIDRRLDAGVKAMVDGVAAGVEATGDGDGVADVERPDRCFIDGGGDFDERHK